MTTNHHLFFIPARVKLTKAKAGKKKVAVTWKTIKKGVTGYQLQVINKKTGKVVKKATVKQTKKIAKKKTVKKAVKKLKKGKYKVRVRAYYKKSGKTYYGKWAKVKSFKVK